MKTLKYLFFFSLIVIAFSACKKDDDTAPQYDHSLILSKGNGTQLVLTNPVDGKDLYRSTPSPAVDDVKSLKAGYMCQNAVFVAKTSLRDYTMSIYTCDAKTGAGTKAITADDLFVEDINTSPAGSEIVFTGKPKDDPQYLSLYTISENGSGLAHISEPLEHVTGPDGGTYELQTTEFPVFSPDGSKIAADALVDNLDHDKFYDFILIMNSDGSSKEVLYSADGKNIGISNLCWTQDGNFLLFVQIDNDDNFHRRVKAMNINSKKVTDITSSLEINGDQVNDISASPNSDKIVFNQHLGGGSDLFIAEFETHDDVLTIKGQPVRITDRGSSGYSYYTPSWQLWDEQ